MKIFFCFLLIFIFAAARPSQGQIVQTGKNISDNIRISQGEVRIYENGQIKWDLKMPGLSIKEAADTIFIPEISLGTFYEPGTVPGSVHGTIPGTGQIILDQIKAREVSLNTKSGALQAIFFECLVPLAKNENFKIFGENFSYSPFNLMSVIKGKTVFLFDKITMETEKVYFDHQNRKIYTNEKVVIKTGGTSLEAAFALRAKAACFSYSKNELFLTGPVQLSGSKIQAKAQTATYFPQKKMLALKGRVQFKKSNKEVFKCEEADFHLDQNIIELKKLERSKIILKKNSTSTSESFF